MPLEEKIITSLTILITGFVVVFAVLLLLILLISLYGKIVSSVLEKSKAKEITEMPKTENLPEVTLFEKEIPEEDDMEIIAVISAAVYAMYGEKSVKVKSIKKVPQSRPVWSTAGIMENTRPF